MSKLKPLTPLQKSWLALMEMEETYRAAQMEGGRLIVSKRWFRSVVPMRWQGYHQAALDSLVTNQWLKKEGKFYELTDAARVNLAQNYHAACEFAWLIPQVAK